MKRKNRSRYRGFTLVELLVVIAIIAALAGLAMPVILRAKKKADLTNATSNLKQLGSLMFEFDQDWGSFPSQTILNANPDQFTGARQGDSANGYLSMLLAGGYTTSEEIFYAKGGSQTSKKPDNVFNTQDKILEPGECGFAYVMLQGNKAMSTSDNSGRPLLLAPVEGSASSSDPKLNLDPYDQKAVYLRLDQSVQQARINKRTQKVVLPGTSPARTLFETGVESVWGTSDQPAVKAPL